VHKASNTLVVIDALERVVTHQRFDNDPINGAPVLQLSMRHQWRERWSLRQIRTV
jgi:hypothetical protein